MAMNPVMGLQLVARRYRWEFRRLEACTDLRRGMSGVWVECQHASRKAATANLMLKPICTSAANRAGLIIFGQQVVARAPRLLKLV